MNLVDEGEAEGAGQNACSKQAGNGRQAQARKDNGNEHGEPRHDGELVEQRYLVH